MENRDYLKTISAALPFIGQRRGNRKERGMWKTILVLLYGGSLSLEAGMTKLQAISMVESGNNDYAIGKAGEISRYQIKPKVWKVYSKSAAYTNTRISTYVAEQHLQSLQKQFKASTGREATDFDCYVMWNGGITYYSRIHFSARAVKRAIRERAERYVNLRDPQEDLPGQARSAETLLRVLPDVAHGSQLLAVHP
jgi:hypothetical protein